MYDWNNYQKREWNQLTVCEECVWVPRDIPPPPKSTPQIWKEEEKKEWEGRGEWGRATEREEAHSRTSKSALGQKYSVQALIAE